MCCSSWGKLSRSDSAYMMYVCVVIERERECVCVCVRERERVWGG